MAFVIHIYTRPRPIRDGFYNYIAKNRYKWFGKKELACIITIP